MTHINREWRIRVHDAGTTTPADGTVDFTLDKIASVPSYGFQRIDPLRGTSETRPWRFSVIDDGTFTTNMADASTGRMDILGRIAEVQVSEDSGSTWSSAAVGRIADVGESEPGTFQVAVSDERWVERRARPVEVADTCKVYPPGLLYQWRGWFPTAYADYELQETSGNLHKLELFSRWKMSSTVAEWIRSDRVDDVQAGRTDGDGNFEHLRLNIGGTDYEVVSLNDDVDADNITAGVQGVQSNAGFTLKAWIYSASAPSASGQAYLWAPTAPPSEALPAHVGTRTTGLGGSVHALGYTNLTDNVWDLVQTVYDAVGVRYDASAFAALDVAPQMAFRVTERIADLAQFLDERVYQPLQVIPFVDSFGRIAPKSVRLPDSSSFDPSTAFEFNSGNMRRVPTWDHPGRDIANVLEYEYDHVSGVGTRLPFTGVPVGPDNFDRDDWPADTLATDARSERIEYDNLSTLGEFVTTVDLSGVPSPSEPGWLTETRVGSYAQLMSQELFQRYGDGAQRGTIYALRKVQDLAGKAPEDVQAGDFVVLNISTYPNAETQARGGERVVQIISREETPDGLQFEFLDAGPNLQALTGPTVAIAQGPNTNHSVTITVSGTPAGTTTTVELDVGTDGTWGRKVTGIGDGARNVFGFPSGTTIRARARAVSPGRIRSAWSAIASVTTAAITGPAAGTPTVDGQDITLPWSGGDTGYSIVPLYRVNGASDWEAEALLPPGSTQYTFTGLDASTLYDVGVKIVDAFGGESAVSSITATTAAAATLAAPTNPHVIQGDVDGRIEPVATAEYGIQVGWDSAVDTAKTRVQIDTDSGFGTASEYLAAAGVEDLAVRLPLDGTLRYVRMRHERNGSTDSAWTATIEAYPTQLAADVEVSTFQAGIVVSDQSGSQLASSRLELAQNFDAAVDATSGQVVLKDRLAVNDGDVSGTGQTIAYRSLAQINLTANYEISTISNFDGVSMLILADLNGFTLSFDATAFDGVGGVTSWTGSQRVLVSVLNPASGNYVVAGAEAIA